MTLEFIKALFLFMVVLGLVWVTTRFVGLRMSGTGSGKVLRVLEHIPAGRDRSIMLLEVGGKVYLVGSTGEHINLLDAIDDPVVLERIRQSMPDQPETPLGTLLPGNFADLLAKLRPPRAEGDGQQPAAPPAGGLDRLKEQVERLRRLQDKGK